MESNRVTGIAFFTAFKFGLSFGNEPPVRQPMFINLEKIAGIKWS